MVRDRGNIKWVSMMLPEHVKLLKEYKQDLQEVEKPVLDEQKYEEFNEIISKAMEENQPLEFTYYQKGELKRIVGYIHQLDHLNKHIHISQGFDYHKVKLTDVIEIE